MDTLEKPQKHNSLWIVRKMLYVYSGLSVAVTTVAAIRDYVKNRLDINRIAGYVLILLMSAVCLLYVLKGLVPERKNNDTDSSEGKKDEKDQQIN